jgi:hypothetical protein
MGAARMATSLVKVLGVILAAIGVGLFAHFYPAPFVIITILSGLILMAAGFYEMVTKE